MSRQEYAEYDEEADALYVTLIADLEIEETVDLDDLRMVDYAADGRVVGIEFISPSAGVDLAGVPFAETVERIIGNSGLPFRILV